MSVSQNSARSNACLGVPVDFYWNGGGTGTSDEHIAQAVEAPMSALKAPSGRLWNPRNERVTRAELRRRLKKASEGRLRPPGELKALRGGDSLFEIRWTDITVHERLVSGAIQYPAIEVRLIHAQPFDELGLCILGLHAHEKVVVKEDPATTKALQDDQIDIAERLLVSGRPTCWGVSRRT